MEIRQAIQLEFREKHDTITKQRLAIMFNNVHLCDTHRLGRVV
jgi:hypothetical protein